MSPGTWVATWPGPKERYHMRLAYEVGTGQYHCGWPFGRTCTRSRSGVMPPQVVVVD